MLHEFLVQVPTIERDDVGQGPFEPVRTGRQDRRCLAVCQFGCGLLGTLAEGVAAFRTVDALAADLGFLAVVENDQRIAVLDTDDLYGEAGVSNT